MRKSTMNRRIKAELVIFFLLVLGRFLIFPPIASAQTVGIPGQRETPFSKNAKGFVSSHLGFTYIPYLDMAEIGHSGNSEITSVSSDYFRSPGFCAGLGIIPVFSNNGIILEVSYNLFGGEFKSEVENDEGVHSGLTTFGFTHVDFTAGYARYFLDGPWHIYFNVVTGLMSESIRTSSEYDQEGEVTSDDRFTNFFAGAGFGFLRQVSTGGIGGEFKFEAPFLKSEFSITDPYGKGDYEMLHPVTLKLMVTFLLGGI